jgi:hypothetical protein
MIKVNPVGSFGEMFSKTPEQNVANVSQAIKNITKKPIYREVFKLTEKLGFEEKINLFMARIGYIYLEARDANPYYFYDETLAGKIKEYIRAHLDFVLDQVDISINSDDLKNEEGK